MPVSKQWLGLGFTLGGLLAADGLIVLLFPGYVAANSPSARAIDQELFQGAILALLLGSVCLFAAIGEYRIQHAESELGDWKRQ